MFQEVGETEPTLTEMSEAPSDAPDPVGGELAELADSEAQKMIQAIEPILNMYEEEINQAQVH